MENFAHENIASKCSTLDVTVLKIVKLQSFASCRILNIENLPHGSLLFYPIRKFPTCRIGDCCDSTCHHKESTLHTGRIEAHTIGKRFHLSRL